MSGYEELTELQKKHQKQLQERRDAMKNRKARVHRLIVRGAISERAVPGAERMTDEQFQKELYRLIEKGKASGLSPPQELSESPPGRRRSSCGTT